MSVFRQILCFLGFHGKCPTFLWTGTISGKKFKLLPTVCPRCHRLVKMQVIENGTLIKDGRYCYLFQKPRQ